MSIWLVDEQLHLTIEVPLGERLQDVLHRQIARLSTTNSQEFQNRLAIGVASALEAALDLDLRLPSERQVAFATVVSNALGVPLPSEALNSRRSMTVFLDSYGKVFKSNAQVRSKPKP